MDLQFQFNQRDGLVAVRMAGELNLRNLTSAFDRLVEHPSFVPGMDAIWDLRHTAVNMRPGDPSKMAEYVRSRRGDRGSRYRLAILTASAAQSSLARVYELVAANLPMEIRRFGDELAARKWHQAGRGQARGSMPLLASVRNMGRVLSPQGT